MLYRERHGLGAPGGATQPRGRVGDHMVGHDTASWATIQPTTRSREATTRPSARAHGLAGGECVTIQSLYSDRSEGLAGWGWVTIQSIVS